MWEDSKSTSDLYLKEEKHLQDYQKRIVLQASQAEVAATTSAITGLPASASSLGREPLRLWHPGATDAPKSGFRSHKPHECKACNIRVSGSTAYKLGHDCYLYLKSHGKTPEKFGVSCPSKYPGWANVTVEEASQLLVEKKRKAVNDQKNKNKKLRDQY